MFGDQPTLGAGVDLPTGQPKTAGLDPHDGSHGYWRKKIGFESRGDRGHPQHPKQGALRFVEGRREQAAMSEASRALVVFGDDKLRNHLHVLADGESHVQPRWLCDTAAVAARVV